METYVLCVIGADRAGLVDVLAEVVAEHGGSWDRSQMTELAGVFAGVVLVRLPEDQVPRFRDALVPLRERGLLEVLLQPAAEGDGSREVDAPADDGAPMLAVAVVGADRPGIVHEVSHALAELGAGIVDLRTWTESAAVAGEALFRIEAVVRLGAEVTPGGVAIALEALADDLMVDLAEA